MFSPPEDWGGTNLSMMVVAVTFSRTTCLMGPGTVATRRERTALASP